jgi:hypothetical protein
MDWLSKHNGLIDYAKKAVRLTPSSGKELKYVAENLVTNKAASNRMVFVTPRSEIAEMKPPYVCPGCLIHTYSNNMINRGHNNTEYLFLTEQPMGLNKITSMQWTNYSWDELSQVSTGGEACLTTVFRILLISHISILDSI